MWCEFERKVHKQPHNTQASLKAKISEVMTNIEREPSSPPRSSGFSSDWGYCGGQWRFNQTDVYVISIKMFPEFLLKYIHPYYLFLLF